MACIDLAPQIYHSMHLNLLILFLIGYASSTFIINKVEPMNITSNDTSTDGNPRQILKCDQKPPTPVDPRPLLSWCRLAVNTYPFPKSENMGIFHVSGGPDGYKLPFTAGINDKEHGGCKVTVDIPFHVSDTYSWYKIWQDTRNLMEACREEGTSYPHTGGYTMTGNEGNIKITMARDSPLKAWGNSMVLNKNLGVNVSATEWTS